jgi:hypothetical protein
MPIPELSMQLNVLVRFRRALRLRFLDNVSSSRTRRPTMRCSGASGQQEKGVKSGLKTPLKQRELLWRFEDWNRRSFHPKFLRQLIAISATPAKASPNL